MAANINGSTVAQVYKVSGDLENTLKALLVYRSDSRNPALATALNAALDALALSLQTNTGAAAPSGS